VPERDRAEPAADRPLFAPDTLEEVIAALEADGSDWAQAELRRCAAKSPLSCKVSLRLLAKAPSAPLRRRDAAEYALATGSCRPTTSSKACARC
jgi:enoyl-CoA hydratase